jgi:polyhydroxybutyrate depolymerase
LLHFHGWGRKSQGVLRNNRIAKAAAEAGALLIAPQGEGRTWSFWRSGSADSDFAVAVLKDAATRWPIDQGRIVVSGYSYGGAMAWRMACDKGAIVTAYLPISGTLRYSEGEDCAEPVRLIHLHGLKDTVMDYPYGPDGDETAAVALWRKESACKAEPDRDWKQLNFRCREWTSCGGPPVTLCTHPGGHYIPGTWLGAVLPGVLAIDGGA